MLSVQHFLTKNGMAPMPHTPYSPGLTPSDFLLLLLLPWMKRVHKGKPFANVEEVKQVTAKALKGIKVDEFKRLLCFEQWEKTSQ